MRPLRGWRVAASTKTGTSRRKWEPDDARRDAAWAILQAFLPGVLGAGVR
ncbi:MAG: hypothetical protein OEW52_10470 [Thermoleophilia bacterium]|nr:hypothetical protein [Thermoleophilia bacterium]MDH4340008.1 hypothetical protein [Thermoleophilia bacterium]MDH5281555.1 hypothetical protein [Thermoleophilia bacterium]